MLETLIYIVQEMNLEQVKLTTTISQLTERVQQNELYLTQLNSNIENLYEHIRVNHRSIFIFCISIGNVFLLQDKILFGRGIRANCFARIFVADNR